MNPFEFKKKSMRHASKSQTRSKVRALLRFLPRSHIALAGALTCSLAVVASLPSEQAQASRQVVELPIPQLQETPVGALGIPDEHIAEGSPQLTNVKVVKETVRSGDSLSLIFARAGLSDKDVFSLVNSCKEAKALAQIYPGHKLTFEIDSDSKLLSLRREIDRLNSELYIREEGGFSYRKDVKTPDVKVAVRSGNITSSLYNAGKEAGVDEQLIMELAGVFGWDIDFALDIRQGDSFKILYEEKFLDGDRIGAGDILAAEFINQGSLFRAVRYIDDSGKAQYYSPTGKAMRKAFLRAPLDFRRISSNFNPKRLHPITKTVRPHRGTDYAASTGTPVWASGDGRVIASGYSRANGNYVFIQHGSDIQTKYLHLHKRKVRTGDRVRQKQIIGSVGSTGMSTAPHLHYEFLLNGVHRNPRTIVKKLPKAESISTEEMPRFLAQTQSIVAQLEGTTRMAAADDGTTSL